MRDKHEPMRRAGWRRYVHLTTCAVLLAVPAIAKPVEAQEHRALAVFDDNGFAERIARTSPELKALRLEFEAARARHGAAGRPGPVVLSGEIEDVPDGYDLGGAAIRLEIGREFLTGGRSAAARALAAAEVREAEVALAAAERRLAARVVQELARGVAATGTARRLAAEDSLLLAAEGSLRDRFSVGEARYVDVLRLRTERLRVQTDLAQAIADARVARAALLGLARPEDRDELTASLDSALIAMATPDESLPAAPPLDSLMMLAGEVGVADAAVERARAGQDVTRAEQRPLFAASIGAQRGIGEDGGRSFGPVLGASLSLPFTARRANAAATLAAERDVEAAEAARVAVVARVRADLAGALALYDAARERLSVYDAALLRGAREERESALAAYRTGELSLLELLDFERALSRAEIERLRARAIAAEAYANLIAASAGGR